MAGKLTCVNIEVTQADAVAGGAIVGPSGTAWLNTGVSNCKYKKFPDGTIELRTLGNGSSPSGTLPAEYRPATTIRFAASAVENTGVNGILQIGSDGTFLTAAMDHTVVQTFRYYGL